MAYQSLLKQVLPKARDYFEVRVCKNDKNKYDKLMDAYALGVQQPHKQSEAWDIIKQLTKYLTVPKQNWISSKFLDENI